MMSRPTKFSREFPNNENFETSLPFKWLASQWPLPPGSYFEMDVRATSNGPAVLSFASSNSPRVGARPIDTIYDATKSALYLSIFAPREVIELLASARHYLFDVRLTRPRGLGAPRVDVIGTGFILIREGITRD